MMPKKQRNKLMKKNSLINCYQPIKKFGNQSEIVNSFISDASEIGEELYPDLLTMYQKVKILLNNTFESLLVATLFCNSIAGMNVGTICYILISLALIRLIDRN